jgi:hypothetical protein
MPLSAPSWPAARPPAAGAGHRGAEGHTRPRSPRCMNGSCHPRSAARGPRELGHRRLPHADCRAGFAIPNTIGVSTRLCRAPWRNAFDTRYHTKLRIPCQVRDLSDATRLRLAERTSILGTRERRRGSRFWGATAALVCRGGAASLRFAAPRSVLLRPGRSASEMSGVSHRPRPQVSPPYRRIRLIPLEGTRVELSETPAGSRLAYWRWKKSADRTRTPDKAIGTVATPYCSAVAGPQSGRGGRQASTRFRAQGTTGHDRDRHRIRPIHSRDRGGDKQWIFRGE